MDVLPVICDGLQNLSFDQWTSAQAVQDNEGKSLQEGEGGSQLCHSGTQALLNPQESSHNSSLTQEAEAIGWWPFSCRLLTFCRRQH